MIDESQFSIKYERAASGDMIANGNREIIYLIANSLLGGSRGYCECNFCDYKGDGVRAIVDNGGGVTLHCPNCSDTIFNVLAIYTPLEQVA